jgi:hypothetical protein
LVFFCISLSHSHFSTSWGDVTGKLHVLELSALLLEKSTVSSEEGEDLKVWHKSEHGGLEFSKHGPWNPTVARDPFRECTSNRFS